MAKQYAVRGLAMILLMALIGFPSSAFAEVEASFEKRLDLDKSGKVTLKNISGDISIRTWKHNEVLIQARKIARRKKDLDKVTIDVSKTNGSVRILTLHQNNRRFGSSNVSVHYELSIPEKASVDVETVSGGVTAEGIGGHLGVTTVSGDLAVAGASEGVRVKGVSGDLRIVNAGNSVRVKSVSGEVHLQTIAGETNVKTVSGDITIDELQGSLEVVSVSGEIVLEGVLKTRNVEAKTVQGSIAYEGGLEKKGDYTLSTHSGDIRMKLPKGSHFELDAETRSGDVACDFDLRISNERSDREIQGMVGKGGARLHLSSFSGDIDIEKK